MRDSVGGLGRIFVKIRVVSEKLTKGCYQTTIETVRGERDGSTVFGVGGVFRKTGFTFPKRSQRSAKGIDLVI